MVKDFVSMLNLKAVCSLHTFYPTDCVSTHASVLCDMNGRELFLQPVGVGEPRGDLNHQRQTLLLLAAQSFHRLPEKVL